MIAKRILVLPCSHVLCQACHAASCQGGSDGLCPMDREPFGAGDASLESTAAIVRDVRASLEEMMAQLVNPDRDQLMSSIPSRMNELTQQMREHEFRLAEFTREVDESTEAEMAQVAASISSKMAGQPRYQSSETAEQVSTTSLQLLRPEKSKTCRQPYLFANLPLGVLQAMRLTSSQDYPQHVVSNCGPRDVKCHLYLTAPLSTTRTWREVEGSVKYVLTLKNCDMDVPAMEKSTIFAQVTVLHTRDAYFTVEVDKNYLFLFVRIGFHGLLAGPQCSMPSFRVKLLDGEPAHYSRLKIHTTMADLRRVHRFRDHTVAGVNWRPTRLFYESPSLRACDLCRMIAGRVLELPCSHLLCQACHAPVAKVAVMEFVPWIESHS
ncbi:hypothetical protein HPB52_024509 [Rhipicephalus sanguineus]|uniref:RING-type domain-containing protein n=1 Tax=Rhipicephalus sanguineus TaxID=34632 RepID=A0A9D4SMF5_RHISA|nr:hypothetical protein HPB52_024509 [Rhipicephalus sanguineus]